MFAAESPAFVTVTRAGTCQTGKHSPLVPKESHMLTASHSDDILQHVAESCQDVGGSHRQHIGTSHAVSYGSDTYEAIDAELDNLKNEVVNLKKERDRASMASEEQNDETPASRLRKLHDSLESTMKAKWPETPRQKSPPKASDFPELGPGTMRPIGWQEPVAQSDRRLSYASAASAGLNKAVEKPSSGARSRRTDSKLDGSSDSPLSIADSGTTVPRIAQPAVGPHTSIAAPRLSVDLEATEATIIVSPHKDLPSSPNGKPAPRFAQATASFARRAGETAQRSKDSLGARPAESSPSKGTRGQEPGAETERRTTQCASKRKSLPRDWTGGTSPQKQTGAGPSSPSTATALPHPKGTVWDMIGKSTIKDAVAATEAQEPEVQKSPKKKTSSYMQPTAAATQRTIATIGEESPKRKPGTLRIDPTVTSRSTNFALPESPATTALAGSTDHALMGVRAAGSIASPDGSRGHRARHAIDTASHGRRAPEIPGTRRAESRKPVIACPKSPSKIPRARKADHVPLTETSCEGAAAVPADPLNVVQNTVTRRRTSHADILQPIFNKLDNQGLLKSKPDAANVAEHKVQEAKASFYGRFVGQVGEEAPESARNMVPALADVAMLARQGIGGQNKALPPHLRASRQSSISSSNADASNVNVKALPPHLRYSRQSSIASSSADASSVNIILQPSATHFKRSQTPVRQDQAIPRNDGAVFGSTVGVANTGAASFQSTKPLTASSLRATAPDFTPLWQPRGPAQELSLLSWQGKLDHMPADTWSSMPPDVKHSIQRLREYSMSPSKKQSMRFWGNLIKASGLPPPVPLTSTELAAENGNQYGPKGQFARPNVEHELLKVSGDGVQAGQVLKPSISPSKSVRWTVQDLNGQQRPVSFGRAPAPPPPADYDMATVGTPIISPTSTDTSPLKTPHNTGTWTIGSDGYTTRSGPYGWKGGDGKEIRFQGYGPHAKRDPNTPVNMQYLGGDGRASDSIGASPSSTCSRLRSSVDKSSPSQRVWPRSRKQWAEFVGLSQKPCGNVEVLEAVESVPFGEPRTGFCNRCVGHCESV